MTDSLNSPASDMTAASGKAEGGAETAGEFQQMDTAPRDGTEIQLVSSQDLTLHRGCWNPEGDAWVDEHGKLGVDCHHLAVTGSWSSGGGWLQPNEVIGWRQLPRDAIPHSDHPLHHFDRTCPACTERILATPAANGPGEAGREEAPPNSLPSYGECALRVGNSKFIDKRVAEGGYGNEYGVPVASELHKFIHEYDDADPYRSAWFLHRLERLLDETRTLASTPQPGMVTVPREDALDAKRYRWLREQHEGKLPLEMDAEGFPMPQEVNALAFTVFYPDPTGCESLVVVPMGNLDETIDAALRSGGREAS